MANRNFARALEHVLKDEGGYVDHPKDPGGATNMGITLRTLADWRGVATLSKAEVKALTRDEAGRIYRKKYWDAIRGDDLPDGVDYATFDFAVNSGVHRASIYLQDILGVAPDGKIGPLTVKATIGKDRARLVNKLCDDRVAFLKRLSTFPTFGRGWMTRVKGVRAEALLMAAQGVDAPSTPPPIPDLPNDYEPTEQPANYGPRILLGLAGLGLIIGAGLKLANII
jgi:lysozyme family protein